MARQRADTAPLCAPLPLQSDTFLKIQSGQLVTPESAPPSGDQSIADAARLWRQVREELTLTTEQEHKLLSQLRCVCDGRAREGKVLAPTSPGSRARSTHENATGAEERQRLLGALVRIVPLSVTDASPRHP